MIPFNLAKHVICDLIRTKRTRRRRAPLVVDRLFLLDSLVLEISAEVLVQPVEQCLPIRPA
jgi:hypothetical protein